ncbi:hypothetical protein [Cryptosporangium phraense]|uniref:hypothetical protein n=1 Tax=Cryptosporangium phraense TaxID=2593070 RepID=UPI003B84798C
MVDALAAKVDVRGRAQAHVADTRTWARQAAARANVSVRAKTGPAVERARGYAVSAKKTASDSNRRTRALFGAGAAAVLLLVVVGVRRRRRTAHTRWYRR